MKTDIWMPLYIGDYVADTRRLSLAEHGAYLLLILDYWMNGPPPNDDSVLARIIGANNGQWIECRPSLERFFQIHDGKWHHKRIDLELQKAAEQQRKIHANSMRGVAARRALGQLPLEPKVQPKVEPTVEPLDSAKENLWRTPSPSPSPLPVPPPPEGTGRRPKSVSPSVLAIQNQNELNRIESRQNEIRSQATTTATGKSFTQSQRDELAKLKNRRQQLLDALGFQA